MDWHRLVVRMAPLVVCLALLAATPAHAQSDAAPVGPLPSDTTYPEFQGLGCLAGGTIVAVGAATYAEVIAAAAIGGASVPLMVPILATAFAVGCSVGAVMAPGVWWIYRRL